MNSDNERRHTQPNNEKSINPYVTSIGNILVSECCGADAKYTVSDKWGFDLCDLCHSCLDGASWLEVKEEDFDREIYLDENENFNFEAYDEKNFQIIPKCLSEAFTEEDLKNKCFYCKTSADEIQGQKVGLLSFKLVGQSINKELDNLTIKACENCYFTHEEELKEVE